MGKRTGQAFYWIVFFLLVLIVAAFGAVLGGMFTKSPAIASAYLWSIVAALILGVLLYRMKMNFSLAKVIGIIMLVISIVLGIELPIKASYDIWMVVMFFYIIITAAVPANVLLQPRDYLNSFLLYAGLLLGLVAAIFAFRGFEVPAFTSFSPILTAGKPTPFWPVIPLIIACGSLSGFHSLVASGTTSKQIEKESDGLFIGFRAMFTEGFLSTTVIVAIAEFGYTALQNAAAAQDAAFTLTAANWGAQFTPVSTKLGLSQANLFVQSYADMVNATWMSIIPIKYVKVVAGMWVVAFAMTTLDTTNRLGRYCITEMADPLKEKASGIYKILTNRFVASVIPAVIGIYLAWSKNFTILWPSFGAANQLIASIALMTGAAYVHKKLRSSYSNVAVIPAWFLWITVTAAMIWFIAVAIPQTIKTTPLTTNSSFSIRRLRA